MSSQERVFSIISASMRASMRVACGSWWLLWGW